MSTLTATPRSPSDRLMRRLLRVSGDPVKGAVFDARNQLRRSIIISGVRCIITYLLVPLVVPLLALAGTVAAPVSIALSVTALVMSHNSLRRFWLADHRYRWHYTGFIGAMWILLLVGIATDIASLLTR